MLPGFNGNQGLVTSLTKSLGLSVTGQPGPAPAGIVPAAGAFAELDATTAPPIRLPQTASARIAFPFKRRFIDFMLSSSFADHPLRVYRSYCAGATTSVEYPSSAIRCGRSTWSQCEMWLGG